MNRLRILVLVILLLIGSTTVGWAAAKFNCNSGGKTWSFTPGSGTIEWTLMVANANTDCDLLVMDSEGTLGALGLSFESRYERVAFAIPGTPLRIVAIKSSGPNSKAYLRGSDSMRFLRGKGGLRYEGTALELAERDPAVARALAQYWRIKPPRQRDE